MPPAPRLPRWLTWVLAAEFLLPAPVLFAMVPEVPTLLVPLAGPWAARLYGHSCGMDSFSPLGTWGLVILGLVSLAGLAYGLRRQRALPTVPAALVWWPAWLGAGFVSVVNAHM